MSQISFPVGSNTVNGVHFDYQFGIHNFIHELYAPSVSFPSYLDEMHSQPRKSSGGFSPSYQNSADISDERSLVSASPVINPLDSLRMATIIFDDTSLVFGADPELETLVSSVFIGGSAVEILSGSFTFNFSGPNVGDIILDGLPVDHNITFPDEGAICLVYQLSGLSQSSPHILTFSNISSLTLDYMLVEAGNMTWLTGQTLLVNSSNSAITYGGNWVQNHTVLGNGVDERLPIGNTSYSTTASSASATVRFTAGTSVSVYGTRDPDMELSSLPTFSIDNNDQTFDASPTPGANYLWFSSQNLSTGQHVLEISLSGNTVLAPFSLEYLTYAPSFESLEAESPSRHVNVIVSVGIGIGACAVVLGILVAILLWRRRRRSSRNEESENTIASHNSSFEDPTSRNLHSAIESSTASTSFSAGTESRKPPSTVQEGGSSSNDRLLVPNRRNTSGTAFSDTTTLRKPPDAFQEAYYPSTKDLPLVPNRRNPLVPTLSDTPASRQPPNTSQVASPSSENQPFVPNRRSTVPTSSTIAPRKLPSIPKEAHSSSTDKPLVPVTTTQKPQNTSQEAHLSSKDRPLLLKRQSEDAPFLRDFSPRPQPEVSADSRLSKYDEYLNTRPLVPRRGQSSSMVQSSRGQPRRSLRSPEHRSFPIPMRSPMQDLERALLALQRDLERWEESGSEESGSGTATSVPQSQNESPTDLNRTSYFEADTNSITTEIHRDIAEGSFGMSAQQLEGLMRELRDGGTSFSQMSEDMVGTGHSTTLAGFMHEMLELQKIRSADVRTMPQIDKKQSKGY
ncbi:hypothetical protein H0H92_000942 [Tricholoma furcatifolium]|nr:hypothetical protein H0H92_000942 [Tricholoma furcatifolium]